MARTYVSTIKYILVVSTFFSYSSFDLKSYAITSTI
uniref:Uncharacterized protein n=1 Tax=Anguilla anguilla TaxID=7936 RepID=A0A0E9S3A5_ANGAN